MRQVLTGGSLKCWCVLSPVSHQDHAQAVLALLLRADGLGLRREEDRPGCLHLTHKVRDGPLVTEIGRMRATKAIKSLAVCGARRMPGGCLHLAIVSQDEVLCS